MTISSATFTRRQIVALLGASTTLAALPSYARTIAPAPASAANALLDDVAWNLLRHEPERATGLGVDTDAHAGMRALLRDPSPAGLAAYADTLRHDLARVRAFDRTGIDAGSRTSLAVVESAYATALEGFAQPYGDVAVGGWRNTPYVVIQNVGGYLDLPRFLDADHPIREAADAEAALSRLAAMPAYLDAELERISDAAGKGLIPPDFLLDKAIPQMESTLADARAGGALVESITRRTADAKIAGDWAARAQPLVAKGIAPALERQLAELKRQRTLAKSDAGMWAQPQGDGWYRWGLKASTTTAMTPEDIHQMGLTQLDEIHARMDPILRSIGYTSGPVGERMTALGTDPRFMFADGDPGRAEIMAFIQQRIDWIKAQMPRAFSTLVPGNLEVRRLPLSEEPGAPTAYGGAGSKDGK
ncbi:MAG: hypothetical protein RLZZ08_2002, partial [Pseudomonadota bacterium]